MKKGLIFTVMLAGVLALGYSQTVLSGTYRYSANAHVTFTGNAFTGLWNATTPMSGTFSVSGNRLTLTITSGPKAKNTWVWTITDANTLRDQDGDTWKKEGTGGSVQARTSPPIEWSVNNTATWIEAVNGIRTGGNNRLHIITVSSTISIPSSSENTFGSVTGVTITIQGGELTLSSNGILLMLGDRQTIIARDITLRGRDGNSSPLVLSDIGSIFRMEGNATVTGNSSSSGGGVFVRGTFLMLDTATVTGNNASRGGGVYIENKGTFTMQGGTVSGNNGGGVYVVEGTFTLEGNASVENNTTSQYLSGSGYGGGVYVDFRGIVTMKGGLIKGNNAIGYQEYSNSAGYGGGVFVYGGTFTMQGGTISSNTANGHTYYSDGGRGGGVYVTNVSRNYTDYKGTFIMQGGMISGNSAGGGGGVYNIGTFTMQGNASVSNNTGGGVATTGTFTMSSNASVSNHTDIGVFVDSGIFTMRDNASVSSNTANNGGGVFITGGTFTMEGGTVSGNTASLSGGGVYIDQKNDSYSRSYKGTFIMKGGTITDNTSGDNGGGVYNKGNFTKTGGTIGGNDAEEGEKNTTAKQGHALYSGDRWRNTTAGPRMNTDSYGFWLND